MRFFSRPTASIVNAEGTVKGDGTAGSSFYAYLSAGQLRQMECGIGRLLNCPKYSKIWSRHSAESAT